MITLMKTVQQNTQQHILDVGYGLIAAKGFTAVGLAEILAKAKVPKGSFYHYFRSKEQFGQALIEAYFTDYLARLQTVLTQSPGTAHTRLIAYWQQWESTQQVCAEAKPCLVVKLSAEVADLSEAMRFALLSGCRQVVAMIGACIEEGQQDGSINQDHDAQQLAQVLYDLWLGASLLNKLSQDNAPFVVALNHTKAMLAPIHSSEPSSSAMPSATLST